MSADPIDAPRGATRGLDQRFAAEPDSVAHARALLTGWLRAVLAGHDRLIADVAQAVSEACNNVVVHAYRTSEGGGAGKSFHLVAGHHGDAVHVTVSDEGGGMTPRSDTPGLGLGLPLIATLSDQVRIGPGTSGLGTTVSMRFIAAGDRPH